ncbi:MAG TPA: hypothetical protein VMV49_02220 [Candidatus Deferrimicrobium sp.]|nr:hypothetical protein [Candidatus Deferrimicrobium sp.]
MKLTDFFLKRPITIQENPSIYKKTLYRAFLATLIFSIIYGIYEYFIVYHTIRLVDILGPELNWLIMYTSLLLTVALASRFSIEQTVMGLFFMAMFEDVVYWMCQWIDTGIYPYPAGNWWDSAFASFRVLGGLGNPIPFWPYVPFYYIPGFTMVFIFYLASYKGAIPSRIASWAIGPFFLAIIAGTMVPDNTARIILIALPLLSYTYILTLFFLKNRLLSVPKEKEFKTINNFSQ